jgi:hypothetical protein
VSDDFLARWSRRKREAVTLPEDDPAVDPEATSPTSQERPVEVDAQVLERLGLKHPEEMSRGDDFAAFLRAEVPKHLKTLALRRLWRSNPTLACLDGLNDYDEDFTGTGVTSQGLKTSYEVGRGLLRRAVDSAEAQPPKTPEKDPIPDTDLYAEREQEAGDDTQGENAPPAKPRDGQPSRAGRRRMAFRPSDHPRSS